MAYTKEQQQAIDERNKNLLVAAAAGSGKTQVMVERIIKLVCEDKIPIDSMLIVTFTNAAASEMRERIQLALENKLEENPENSHIKKQIELLPRSSIGTMHSFCIEVIRSNFNVVSIDPGFKMGLDSTITVLKSKVLEELFEEKYDLSDQGFVKLVDAFGGRTDENLKDLVLKTHSSIQAQPYPMKWLKTQVENYFMTKDSFYSSIYLETLLNQLGNEINSALSINVLAIKYGEYSEGPYLYLPALENDKEVILYYKKLINERRIDEILEYANNLSFERATSIKKSDIESGISQNLVDKTKSLRDDYKKRLKDTIKLLPTTSFEKEIEKLNEMHPLLEALNDLVKNFNDVFDRAKRKKGVLDFNDLEHLTLEILENKNIKQQYRNKFNYIFFDEYQDSNLVQETIINSIKRENNLFFVGDVKQAIYRFRLSEPRLFNQRYADYDSVNDIYSKKIDLSKNFRSNSKVIDFTNFIFKNLMSEDLGQVDYLKEEVQLISGMEFPSEDGGIELNIISLSKNEKQDATATLDSEDPDDDAEFKFIVERIKNLIGNDIYKPKQKTTTKVDFADIAVLFRSPKNSINKLARLLTENDIPNVVDYSEINATSIEVLVLFDYLKIIDNRFQDEALLGALTSFFGVLTFDDVIDIKIKYPNEKFLYNAIDIYRYEQIDEISKKLNVFFENIQTYKRRESLYELSEFIWQIITENGYLTYLNSLKMGEQKKHNVLSLIEKAKEYSDGESNKLFGFLLYIDKIFKDKQDKIDNIVTDNENVVRLMSIHKSKGLEFPIVILCDTKKKFNEQEYKDDLIYHNELGIGSKYIDVYNNTYSSTLPRNIIIAKKKQEALSEEVRILYVAFTRAINKLIIVGSTKNISTTINKIKKGKDSSLLKKINNYFDWIMSVMWNHGSMNKVREIFEEELLDFEIENDLIDIKVNLISEQDIKNQQEKSIKSQKNMRRTLNLLIDKQEVTDKDIIIEKVAEEIVNQPIKFSVTEIAKSKEEDYSQKYNKKRLHKTPKSLQGIKELTPMEKGTLMHSVLEHLDLQKEYSFDDIKKEIDVMVQKEKLTEEEAVYIDIEGILGVYESEVGEKIKKAIEIHKEETFLLKYEGKIIDGIIDCYLINQDNEITLIDYKTDKNIQMDKYLKQLQLYKMALEKQYKTKVKEVYIYWFNHRIFTKLDI